MKVRPRDFVYTTDGLYFATTSYHHPKNRVLAFLRYIPDDNGEREKDGKKYTKVDSETAYKFLEENYPYYLFDDDNTGLKMMGVPSDKIKKILRPNERLKEIMESDTDSQFFKKVITLAETFHKYADVPYDCLGISGSVLPGLNDSTVSDIDFVVYGMENQRRAMNLFGEIKDTDEFPLFKSIHDDYWMKVYNKRIKDDTLSFDEFCWYEKRKNNRGIIDGTLFDILLTRDWDEITGEYGDIRYESYEQTKIEAKVVSALASFDNPSICTIEEVSVIDGPEKKDIKEVASFTHTYAGEVKDNEDIVAKGKLEKVINTKTGETYHRIVVGTTREAFNEYIKLKESPI